MSAMTVINLASASMNELVEWYNSHSGKDPVKRFKDKAQGQQACQLVMASLEGTSDPEMEEEASVVYEDALSASAQLMALASSGGNTKTGDKNEGVWLNVKRLLEQGLGNKDILKKIHELYGNSNTSYACIAWYRNKWNKTKDQGPTREEQILNICKMYGLSEEAYQALVSIK